MTTVVLTAMCWVPHKALSTHQLMSPSQNSAKEELCSHSRGRKTETQRGCVQALWTQRRTGLSVISRASL